MAGGGGGGTVCSAVGGPRGINFSARTFRGDQFFCHGRSGGTNFGGDQLSYDRPPFFLEKSASRLSDFG